MAGNLKWYGKQQEARIRRVLPKALTAAALVVEAQSTVNLTRVVYNTPQRGGYKRTGALRAAIMHDPPAGDAIRVTYGPVEYAIYVEYGTRFMAARPFLRPAVDEHKPEIRKAFAATLRRLL